MILSLATQSASVAPYSTNAMLSFPAADHGVRAWELRRGEEAPGSGAYPNDNLLEIRRLPICRQIRAGVLAVRDDDQSIGCVGDRVERSHLRPRLECIHRCGWASTAGCDQGYRHNCVPHSMNLFATSDAAIPVLP